MSENRKIHVAMLRAAAVLLVLTLMTASIVSGHYARYTTSVTVSDSARVAKYEVTVTAGSDNQLVLDPNGSKTVSYNFLVASGSEVRVEYDLVITLPQALQAGISLSLTRDDEPVALTLQENNIYKAVGTFTPAGGTHAYVLTFTAKGPIGADQLDNIAIRVNARQAD